MKGLLLKDLYMAKTHCRSVLLIAIVFLAVSCLGEESNLFFTFYPAVLCGMIPITLLSYDERSGWIAYSDILPASRAQFVSAKYLIGLIASALMYLITAAVQAFKMTAGGGFAPEEFTAFLMLLLIVSVVLPAIALPSLFKFGVEKGKYAYYFVIGFTCAIILILTRKAGEIAQAAIAPSGMLVGITLACLAVYVISWRLSIRFYQKRELS